MAKIPTTRLARLLTGWASEGSGPLPRRLADALRELAERADVPAGSTLPSQRELALVLGVSRSTVTAAYSLLEESGWLESRRGSGSRLRGSGSIDEGAGEGRLASFDARTGTVDLSSGALDGLGTVGDVVGALTADDLAPLLRADGYLPYGLPELREGIAAYYRAAGVPTGPEQILVTSGSQQAVWLVAQALVDPGDTVVVENPTYRGALEALRSRRARLVPVGGDRPGADRDGADPGALRRFGAAVRPRLVYLQPTVHNPTGRGLDGAAQRAWASALAEREVFTVEDTSCAELALDGDGPPVPLAAGLPDASTIVVGTLSKLFWGGLRVGWVRSSPQVVARLAKIKTSVDLSCPVVEQLVAVRLLGRLPQARTTRRTVLREQRAGAEKLLRSRAPHWEWDRPAGGAALWVRVPGTDTEAMAQWARRRGVSVVPGSAFSAVDGFRDRLRLPYAHGVDALERALPTLLESAERSRSEKSSAKGQEGAQPSG
ncbi:PLP-dependent aminotransferase family protein [Streptomyces formicae]|uniref:Transcriptional regulator, GntR family domain / Aspartate aminotransferase n=1 Tax=Streptomyces formicae TaxID=1616117 RepID=A0A291Q0K4_9ACTN|nr:PLP-dependent aminotransferase family protein [Streptomyces formicae]ATL25261.1 Transcriptional regulator, GntR family domain / Aspartate aminotransferase [Streptomyces formicae]